MNPEDEIDVVDTPEVEETEEEVQSTADVALAAWNELSEDEEDSPEDKPSEEEQSGDEDESDDVVAATGGEDDQTDAEPLSAPEHWTAEDKALFDTQTDEGKEFLVARDKHLAAEYTRKTEELADLRKGDQPLYDLAEQTRQHFATQGVTPAAGMAQLVQAQQALLNGTPEQRRAALEQIGASYGIPLTPGTSDSFEDEYQDPELGKFNQRMDRLESFLVQTQQTATTQQQQSDLQMVITFANEKNEAGELKYPPFETLRPLMSVLIGRAGSLEGAYEQASMADPATRKLVLEALAKPGKAEEDKARNERVAKAKRAAPSNTRSKTAAVTKTKIGSTKDAATEAWDEISAA